mmetsp:Transcript_31054/g.69837  ORF Transcript_31054/g.69837 Transcript_31054/m.69837 type:complete len:104 (-) Transcript_31054:116-427(-)
MNAQKAAKIAAVKCIQRSWRGHHLRNGMWRQVLDNRATRIQAAIRGFLVRCRHRHLLVSVTTIQRHRRALAKAPVPAAGADQTQIVPVSTEPQVEAEVPAPSE